MMLVMMMSPFAPFFTSVHVEGCSSLVRREGLVAMKTKVKGSELWEGSSSFFFFFCKKFACF